MSSYVAYHLQGPKADGLAGLPTPLAVSSGNLDPRGAFLLNDGLRFVLWLGKGLPTEFVKDLLGPEVAFTADSSQVGPTPILLFVVYPKPLLSDLESVVRLSLIC